MARVYHRPRDTPRVHRPRGGHFSGRLPKQSADALGALDFRRFRLLSVPTPTLAMTWPPVCNMRTFAISAGGDHGSRRTRIALHWAGWLSWFRPRTPKHRLTQRRLRRSAPPQRGCCCVLAFRRCRLSSRSAQTSEPDVQQALLNAVSVGTGMADAGSDELLAALAGCAVEPVSLALRVPF